MKEIAIIKLGADGDVIRTLPLAQAIKKQNKQCNITWITKGDIADIVSLCPYVDFVEKIPYLKNKQFDEAYNFDVDEQALKIIKDINAKEKKGFYDIDGYPAAYSAEGEYYLNTMFDDSLKKSNKKTYQQMMFDAVNLKQEDCGVSIKLDKESIEYAEEFKIKNKLSEKVIGIHMGASSRWPSKAWHIDNVEKFIEMASKEYKIILFSGPNEVEKQKIILEKLKVKGISVSVNNPNNSKKEFMSLLALCRYVVCADSFALHAALALKKKTVALFFVTSATEVEGYGLLEKIVAEKLYDFFPEKSDIYNEDLTKSIKAEKVMECIKKWEHKA